MFRTRTTSTSRSLTARSTGTAIKPAYLVETASGRNSENDLGNAPDLLPGQSATGTVTIDVPGLHGLIVYDGSDDGQVDGSWSY